MPIQPNPLTDEWGGTYLQVIIALLVLAAGIPAFLLQLRTAPEIHRVVIRQRYDRMKVMSGMLAIYILIALVFIWWFNTEPTEKRSASDWSAALVMSLVIILTALLWLRQIELTARERIIRRLVRQAVREYKKTRSFTATTISDILDLGTATSRHDERRLVLTEIRELVRAIRKLPVYQGDGLGELLNAVSPIATGPALPINAENIELGARILLETCQAHRSAPAHPSLTPDVMASIRALMHMLSDITLNAPERTVNQLLQEFSMIEEFPPSLSARGLFQVGRIALDGKRNHLVLLCLNHMEDMLYRLQQNDNIPEQGRKHQRTIVETNLLGLAAHLWKRYPSGRQRLFARPSLALITNAFTRDQRQSAQEYFWDDADFETAALISMFYREFTDSRTLRKEAGQPTKPKPRSRNRIDPQQPESPMRFLLLAFLAFLSRKNG